MNDIPELSIALEQPYGVEIKMTDGIFVKQMAIPRAGTYVPQHSHSYEHLSMLAVGRIRVWRDGKDMGEFEAPVGITIPARCKHTFLSLVDGTVVYCIHHLRDGEGVDIHDEHTLVGDA